MVVVVMVVVGNRAQLLNYWKRVGSQVTRAPTHMTLDSLDYYNITFLQKFNNSYERSCVSCTVVEVLE